MYNSLKQRLLDFSSNAINLYKWGSLKLILEKEKKEHNVIFLFAVLIKIAIFIHKFIVLLKKQVTYIYRPKFKLLYLKIIWR